jgi:hypothetical protein
VPAVGGGKRGAGHSKRKDSAEGAVVVVDAPPPRTPHDHMDRSNLNCTFADEQLDFSIGSLAENVESVPLYYKALHPSLCQWRFQTRILDSGWIQGVCADISSRTLGRYVAVINTAPPRRRSNGFQRVYVAPQTTPEEPRQRNGPLGAPKRRPDPPQPAPHPPRLVCGGNHGAGTH